MLTTRALARVDPQARSSPNTNKDSHRRPSVPAGEKSPQHIRSSHAPCTHSGYKKRARKKEGCRSGSLEEQPHRTHYSTAPADSSSPSIAHPLPCDPALASTHTRQGIINTQRKSQSLAVCSPVATILQTEVVGNLMVRCSSLPWCTRSYEPTWTRLSSWRSPVPGMDTRDRRRGGDGGWKPGNARRDEDAGGLPT